MHMVNLSRARENELGEQVPVPHDNCMKSIYSLRACGEGYICLMSPPLLGGMKDELP